MDLLPAILDVGERYSSASFVLLLCTLGCTATLYQLQNVVLLLPIHITDCFIAVPSENKYSMRTVRSRPKHAVQLSGNTSQRHEEFTTSVLSCKAHSPCRQTLITAPWSMLQCEYQHVSRRNTSKISQPFQVHWRCRCMGTAGVLW